jgi:uncharacterized protein
MAIVRDLSELESIYGAPAEAATVKEVAFVTAEYGRFIEAAPFVALATSGPGGLDCSPRGDERGFVRVHDTKTLMLPDRRGNNRIDSLRNIVCDPRVALLFLIPGVGNTLRVNGRAQIDTDPALLDSFAVAGSTPRSVLVIHVDAVYFQCARCILRSGLWNPALHLDPKHLPTPGQILASRSEGRVGGEDYDRSWGERARKTLW